MKALNYEETFSNMPTKFNGISVGFKLITPQIAKLILEKNDMNRVFNNYKKATYRRVMAAGLWKEGTGETIQFAEDWTLLNGQHRLNALISANVSLTFLVVRDLEKNVFPVLDTGKSRTTFDSFHISGVPNGNVIAAGIVRYLNLKKGAVVSETRTLTPDELLNYYTNNKEHITLLYKNVETWRRKSQRLLTGSEILGLYAYFYDVDNDDAFTFMDSLCTGENLIANGPVMQCRNKLLFAKINKKLALIPSVKYAYIIKAWNFFRKGETKKHLRFDSEQESYPFAK